MPAHPFFQLVSSQQSKRTVLLALTMAMQSFTAVASDGQDVQWSNNTQQPHFADVNGDGIQDLLLQSKDTAHDSWLVTGQPDASGNLKYLVSNKQLLPQEKVDLRSLKVLQKSKESFLTFLTSLDVTLDFMSFIPDNKIQHKTIQTAGWIQFISILKYWLQDSR